MGKRDGLRQPIEKSVNSEESQQARIRQQLAIHSLIRQANFESGDGDYGVTVTGVKPSTAPEGGAPAGFDQAVLSGTPVAEGLQHAERAMTAKSRTTEQQQRCSHEAAAMRTQNPIVEPIWPDSHGPSESQNTMGLAFNPWMGFSESLESYGLTLSLDEDYF